MVAHHATVTPATDVKANNLKQLDSRSMQFTPDKNGEPIKQLFKTNMPFNQTHRRQSSLSMR